VGYVEYIWSKEKGYVGLKSLRDCIPPKKREKKYMS
jgi:hypothetical protein